MEVVVVDILGELEACLDEQKVVDILDSLEPNQWFGLGFLYWTFFVSF